MPYTIILAAWIAGSTAMSFAELWHALHAHHEMLDADTEYRVECFKRERGTHMNNTAFILICNLVFMLCMFVR